MTHEQLGREVAALGLTIDHIKAMQRACAGMTTEQLKDAAIDYKSALGVVAAGLPKHREHESLDAHLNYQLGLVAGYNDAIAALQHLINQAIEGK